jgi:hypothetical protein
MSTNRAPTESGLQDLRLEWVEEQTVGQFPSDPDWNAFSNEVSEFDAETDGNKEGRDVAGSIDPTEYDRANETATVEVAYRQAKYPVDTSGNVVDPIAYPITEALDTDYPSHTIVGRRDVAGGGRLDAGFREITVVVGAKPVESTFDGDPSSAEPLPQDLVYEAQRARSHIVHQPSGSETLVVRSTDGADTNEVIIESEDAATSETLTLPGSSPNTVATGTTFDDIDAIEVVGEHQGDIQVGTDDGTGAIDTELLEDPLTGVNTDGVDSIPGIPSLGTGSHATVPTEIGPVFLGTNATWVGQALSDRVHALEMTVTRDVSREAQQGTRRQTIDVGTRDVEVSADLAGPYETASLIADYHRDKKGDLVWDFGNNRNITARNVELTDAPDITREAGENNFVPSVTLQPSGDPAIEINNA